MAPQSLHIAIKLILYFTITLILYKTKIQTKMIKSEGSSNHVNLNACGITLTRVEFSTNSEFLWLGFQRCSFIDFIQESLETLLLWPVAEGGGSRRVNESSIHCKKMRKLRRTCPSWLFISLHLISGHNTSMDKGHELRNKLIHEEFTHYGRAICPSPSYHVTHYVWRLYFLGSMLPGVSNPLANPYNPLVGPHAWGTKSTNH